MRLREIFLGVLHELGHGLLTAEAISLALELRIDGAVRLYVLAGRKTLRAHITEFTSYGHGSRGHTNQESASDCGREVRSNHDLLPGVRRSSPSAIEYLVSDTYNSNLRVIAFPHDSRRPGPLHNLPELALVAAAPFFYTRRHAASLK